MWPHLTLILTPSVKLSQRWLHLRDFCQLSTPLVAFLEGDKASRLRQWETVFTSGKKIHLAADHPTTMGTFHRKVWSFNLQDLLFYWSQEKIQLTGCLGGFTSTHTLTTDCSHPNRVLQLWSELGDQLLSWSNDSGPGVWKVNNNAQNPFCFGQ